MWEYRTKQGDRAYIYQEINSLGESGWELVSVVFDSIGQSYSAWLKRKTDRTNRIGACSLGYVGPYGDDVGQNER